MFGILGDNSTCEAFAVVCNCLQMRQKQTVLGRLQKNYIKE